MNTAIRDPIQVPIPSQDSRATPLNPFLLHFYNIVMSKQEEITTVAEMVEVTPNVETVTFPEGGVQGWLVIFGVSEGAINWYSSHWL